MTMDYVQLPSGTVLEISDAGIWPEAKLLTRAKGKQIMRDEALAYLREILKPGDTVSCVLRHVSRSGMSRRIDFYKSEGGEMLYLTGRIAHVLDMRVSDASGGGLVVGGCGMDMGFSVVYNLSSALYPQGFTCIGERCPSNDHNNGDRDHTPHHHQSGGYAMRCRWL
jgi:hypothetical protein